MGKHGSDRAVGVFDLEELTPRLEVAERGLAGLDEVAVQHIVDAMVLLLRLGGARRGVEVVGWNEKRAEVEALVKREFALFEQVDAADEVVHPPDAQARHDLAGLLGNHEEEVDDVFGSSREHLAQLRVLGADSDRTSVEVAFTHHDAAERDQRRSGEAELFGAEHRALDDVEASLELAVGLYNDTVSESVKDKRLVSFREPELPGESGGLDSRPLRSSSSTIVAGNKDMVSLTLSDSGGDDSDTDFGDQLDADTSGRVGVLEVVNQLGQVLDTVDIVVRRRRDEADSGSGVAHRCDFVVNLVAGELAALSGLGSLGHLDLDFVGVRQVVDSDSEAPGGHLLDRGVLVGSETGDVLASFAGVRLALEVVHGLREGRVGLHGDRTVAHRAGSEALDDFLGGLDEVERDLLAVDEFVFVVEVSLEFKLPAQSALLGEVVGHLRVALVGFAGVAADGVLHGGHGVGVVHVDLGVVAGAPVVEARVCESLFGVADGVLREGAGMHLDEVFRDILEAHAADTARAAGEALVDDVAADSECFEDLGSLVAGKSGNSHLGENLEHSVLDGLAVGFDGLLDGQGLLGLRLHEVLDGFICHVRADSVGAEAGE
mmetsp:Transcript_20988/g.37386  ORF Transcript_20988/g.37386 Transcript_20988/m.37386 type:complete len:604 (+) Transcript_20988:2950-4761(+)